VKGAAAGIHFFCFLGRLRSFGPYDSQTTYTKPLGAESKACLENFLGVAFDQTIPWEGVIDYNAIPLAMKSIVVGDDGPLCSAALDIIFRQFNQVHIPSLARQFDAGRTRFLFLAYTKMKVTVNLAEL
jgi:hypothetical protein